MISLLDYLLYLVFEAAPCWPVYGTVYRCLVYSSDGRPKAYFSALRYLTLAVVNYLNVELIETMK
jgi:hypothetical protein